MVSSDDGILDLARRIQSCRDEIIYLNTINCFGISYDEKISREAQFIRAERRLSRLINEREGVVGE